MLSPGQPACRNTTMRGVGLERPDFERQSLQSAEVFIQQNK